MPSSEYLNKLRNVRAGKEVPPFGEAYEVLMKTAGAWYYTAWARIDDALNNSDGCIDEGEY